MTEGDAASPAGGRGRRARGGGRDDRASPPRSPRRAAPASAPSTRGSCASCAPRSAPTSASAPPSLVPVIFIVALLADERRRPGGLPFGALRARVRPGDPARRASSSASIWLFPLVTALVAGDIVATEDDNGTLKTILTRSVERWQVFAGKVLAALTYTFAALVALRRSSGLVIGGLIWGFDPLISLSGTHDLGRPRAGADRRGRARLLHADDRGRLDRAAALDASRATPRRRSSGR